LPDRPVAIIDYLLIDIDSFFETEALAESTTLTVNEDVPLLVGMPICALFSS
jgi:hypothetical protein